MIKKSIKSILIIFVSIMCIFPISLNIKASDVELFSSNNIIEDHYVIAKAPFDNSISIRINYKLRRTNTGTGEVLLGFNKYTSSTITTGYTFTIESAMTATGYSSNIDANQYLRIKINYNIYKNNAYLGSVKLTISYHMNASPTIYYG